MNIHPEKVGKTTHKKMDLEGCEKCFEKVATFLAFFFSGKKFKINNLFVVGNKNPDFTFQR